jgi:CheY-like chemotaxis protein
MAASKILLLDDDTAFTELYREMLSKHLTSMPEVKAATTGSRALSMLDAEPFNMLIVDLNMPKMDGLQVLSIVRRKHPHVRLVVLTGVRDEQFRTRAYAMGVDQYWIKPESDQEVGLFLESIESLLSRETQGGFRGVQSKSLVDIIQLECLSQSSCLLKISNGLIEGKIWIQNGEVIDAEAAGLVAEAAFQRILAWKTGSFEILPPDGTRERTIQESYQGLLLNSAQALDEATAAAPTQDSTTSTPATFALADISQWPGVEFAMAVRGRKAKDYYGIENPGPVGQWLEETLKNFQELGDYLQVGQLQEVVGSGPKRKIAMATLSGSQICIGFPATVSPEQLRETFKKILEKWAS